MKVKIVGWLYAQIIKEEAGTKVFSPEINRTNNAYIPLRDLTNVFSTNTMF
ncbi:hypothetical protein J2Z23_002100 [Lederbergia galactosidilyticus]|uniref:hypothetical protein n=1 Tax=Lederbergia galactosidilytica TaxID=217031 RepID=UPI000A90EAE5|nr:hypothetical protein [Lederbergia galactosidilytica]MBP1915143.1 hypothetical protein [Lederbergia galactosidilytica]